MLLKEALGKNEKNLNFKIFSCDVSQKRIAIASKGEYLLKFAKQIPEKYHQYFTAVANNKISFKNNIRKHLIFSSYDYLSASPMSNMDIVVCRNVLIYLKPMLQEKVSRMFRFSLKTNGVLLLGQSESFLKNNRSFKVIDEHLSIYKNISKTVLLPDTYLDSYDNKGLENPLIPLKKDPVKKSFDFLPNLLNDNLIEELNLAVIYADAFGNIIKASGDFRSYFQLPKSGFSSNIYELLPLGIVNTVKDAIDSALKNEKKTKISNINLPEMEEKKAIDIICSRFLLMTTNLKFLLFFYPPLLKHQKTI